MNAESDSAVVPSTSLGSGFIGAGKLREILIGIMLNDGISSGARGISSGIILTIFLYFIYLIIYGSLIS